MKEFEDWSAATTKADNMKELLKDVDLQDAMYAIKELEFDQTYQRLVEHYETFCDKTV